MKKLRNQLIFDIVMLPVSIYLLIDSLLLFQGGDDSLKRKIIVIFWGVAVIAWSVRLIYDLKIKFSQNKSEAG